MRTTRDATDAMMKTAIDAVTEPELAELAGTVHAVHRTYNTLPFAAISASREALEISGA